MFLVDAGVDGPIVHHPRPNAAAVAHRVCPTQRTWPVHRRAVRLSICWTACHHAVQTVGHVHEAVRGAVQQTVAPVANVWAVDKAGAVEHTAVADAVIHAAVSNTADAASNWVAPVHWAVDRRLLLAAVGWSNNAAAATEGAVVAGGERAAVGGVGLERDGVAGEGVGSAAGLSRARLSECRVNIIYIQGVWKMLPDGKVEIFFWTQGI